MSRSAHAAASSAQGVTLLDEALLDELTRKAQGAPRLRVHRNFHPDEGYPSHRLAVAMEPGSYIPPHCHLDPAKDETLLILRGRLGVLLFDGEGRITRTQILDPRAGCFGLTLPHGTLHSLISLLPGSAFFESKAGPYAAPEGDECPPWAPREGAPEALAYLERLRAAL